MNSSTASKSKKSTTSTKKFPETYKFYFNHTARSKQKVEKVSDREWDALEELRSAYAKVEECGPLFKT